MDYKILNINTVNSKSAGSLSFFQNEAIGFEVKRMYYIYGVKTGTKRGGHAHRELKQLLFCPYGSVEIIMDDGKDRVALTLNKENVGLLLPPEIWHEMRWLSDGAILCVAASMEYDEHDYIRDYGEFIKLANAKRIQNGIS